MLQNKKYELTNETITLPATNERPEGVVLYRIKALRSFYSCSAHITKGDLGGYVESYDNLSQEDSAWIADDAMVYGRAKVSGSAHIGGSTQVFGNAIIRGEATVCDDYGRTWVHGGAIIEDAAVVKGNDDFIYMKGFALNSFGSLCNDEITFYQTNYGEIMASMPSDTCQTLSGLKRLVEHDFEEDLKSQVECEMVINLVKYHFLGKED